jgi:hypothetical protein
MAPWTRSSAAVLLVWAMSGCGDPPAAPPDGAVCASPPAAAGAWSVATPGGPTLHWSLAQGCVAVTYDPALAPHLAALQLSVNAWNALACGRMCYAAPTPSSTRPDRANRNDRRLHLRPTATVDPAASSIYVDTPTGRILSADLAVPSVKVNEDVRGAFARALGQGLGMRAGATTVPSVLAVSMMLRTSAPTDGDRVRVCAVYAPPWCAD